MPKKGKVPTALKSHLFKKGAGKKSGSAKKMPAGLAKKLSKKR